MDIAYIIINELGEGVEYNPACFEFDEQEAKKRNLWRSKKPMPSKESLMTLWSSKYEKMLADEMEVPKKKREKKGKDLKAVNKLLKAEVVDPVAVIKKLVKYIEENV